MSAPLFESGSLSTKTSIRSTRSGRTEAATPIQTVHLGPHQVSPPNLPWQCGCPLPLDLPPSFPSSLGLMKTSKLQPVQLLGSSGRLYGDICGPRCAGSKVQPGSPDCPSLQPRAVPRPMSAPMVDVPARQHWAPRKLWPGSSPSQPREWQITSTVTLTILVLSLP